MPAFESLLALALAAVLALVGLAVGLVRRARRAEADAGRRDAVVATLGAVAVEMASADADPVSVVSGGLGGLGCPDVSVVVLDEPSGRWVPLSVSADGDPSVPRSVARVVARAWDTGATVAAESVETGPGTVIACPVQAGTGVPTVLVARASPTARPREATAAVEVSAGLLGAAKPMRLHPVGDDREPAEGRASGPVDSLTGLGTASSFYAAMERRCRKGKPVGLLLIAVDGIDAVTGQYGSRSGDEVVRVAARRLRRCVRPDDELARVDPTIFGVLLAEASHPDGADAVGSRALAALGSPVAITGAEAQIAGRVAVVWDASGSEPPSTLLPEARSALARADGLTTTIRIGEELAPQDRAAR